MCIEQGLKFCQTVGSSMLTTLELTECSQEVCGQKTSIVGLEQDSYSLGLASIDFWPFPELKSTFKEDIRTSETFRKMQLKCSRLFQKRNSINFSNSVIIAGQSVATQQDYCKGDPSY
jgi:hypothetical protein